MIIEKIQGQYIYIHPSHLYSNILVLRKSKEMNFLKLIPTEFCFFANVHKIKNFERKGKNYEVHFIIKNMFGEWT